LSSLERILKRRRDGNEAEVDDLRQVVLARLSTINGTTADHLPPADPRPVMVRRINGDTPDGAIAHSGAKSPAQLPTPWLLVAPLEDPSEAVAEPSLIEPPPPAETEVDLVYEALAGGAILDEAADGEAPIASDAREIEAHPQDQEVDSADAVIPFEPRPGRRPARAAAAERRRPDARGEATPRRSAEPVGVEPTPCCPYCAVLLESPPERDDRCPRCHQLIVVRYIGARMALLAESVLPFFETERRNEERWALERDRWLALAREGRTNDGQGPRLAGELISEEDVDAARAWYLSGADRAFHVAESERRWEEAARIRYQQADVLFGINGSPGSPSEEVLWLHRDGLAADLQAIGEVARHAEVRGEACCEACAGDDRRIVEIAEELRSPTLPHEGCPDGLCRCRWFLTARDQEVLAALLRRRGLGAMMPEA
jgi:hypothetical protein